jgi:CDP-6-deoxy-D-xylo-4-hexulose-3-dehydrase
MIHYLFTKNSNLAGLLEYPYELNEAKTSWFGYPVICKNYDVKRQLVEHLESNNIQTRNYFAGNILLHPGYKHLGDYTEYPNANTVLENVFFIGCAPQYTKEVFEYIDKVLGDFKYEK